MSNSFKDWYEQRYGPYPGVSGERSETVWARVADAMATYADERIAKAIAEAKEPEGPLNAD